jgi:hypothetical protein
MRTKTVSLTLLLAAAALTAQAAPTVEAAAERAAREPAPTTVGSLDQRAGARSAPAARAEQKAPAVGVGSPFSVFTYEALGATPRIELRRHRAAPDATQPKSVATR